MLTRLGEFRLPKKAEKTTSTALSKLGKTLGLLLTPPTPATFSFSGNASTRLTNQLIGGSQSASMNPIRGAIQLTRDVVLDFYFRREQREPRMAFGDFVDLDFGANLCCWRFGHVVRAKQI
jgi:hypothetical protein